MSTEIQFQSYLAKSVVVDGRTDGWGRERMTINEKLRRITRGVSGQHSFVSCLSITGGRAPGYLESRKASSCNLEVSHLLSEFEARQLSNFRKPRDLHHGHSRPEHKISDRYTYHECEQISQQMTIYLGILQVDSANVLTRQKKGEELESNERTTHHDPAILPLDKEGNNQSFWQREESGRCPLPWQFHTGLLTCGTAAWLLQLRSPHPAGMHWPCPCLWCHTPWSGNSVNSPVSPETPLAGTEYTGWSCEGNKGHIHTVTPLFRKGHQMSSF